MSPVDVEAALRARLSPNRFAHSLSVAAFAKTLAGSFGLDSERAHMAGMIHDYAKELPRNELESEIRRKRELTDVELAFPHILHAEVSAIQARRDLGILDEETLAAAEAHTLAGVGLPPLAKVLFIADFLEPGRKFPEAGELRKGLGKGLDADYKACLQAKILHLISKGLALHHRMVAAWNEAVLA